MTVSSWMATMSRACAWALMLSSCAWQPVNAENESDVATIAAGKRIYREGILPSGQALRGKIGADVVVSGARAACVNCHRRSGYGGVEGDRIVPPVVGRYLFGDTSVSATAAVDTASARGDYYDADRFRRALRAGLTRAGQPLKAPMPRFQISDRDAAALMHYLTTLSTPAPGVSATEIHFATVVTDAVPERQRAALLGVLNAFIDAQNAERRANTSKVQRSPLGHTRVYRATQQWRLHVWTLKGSPQDWAGQIDRYYRAQPVFAVLGGVVRTHADAVHAQCERLQLPCLFPNVDASEPKPGDYFSIYFTRGVIQEAEVLGEIWRRNRAAAPRRIVQVYRAHDSGAAAARALRVTLSALPQLHLEDYVIAEADVGRDAWSASLPSDVDAIVLWLRSEDVAQLPSTFGARAQLFLSDTLADSAALPAALRARTAVLRLRELPFAWEDRRQHIETWLRAYRVALTDEPIQSNTYVTLTLISRILTHMRENISREYLIEQIEHEAQTASWASIYPRLSLAPNQRVASRGGYRVPLQDDGSLPATAPWIVPGVANHN